MAGQYYTFGPYRANGPNFGSTFYDSTQLINDSRILGPQAYADAVAFWYRPDHTVMFEQQQGTHGWTGGSGPSEQVKHRRTRSGCYTCRSRRVKCDEKRPICARCTKGNRECVYPEPSSSGKGGVSRARAREGKQARQNSQSSEDSPGKKQLPTIKDEDEEDDAGSEGLALDQPLPTKRSQSPARKESAQAPVSQRESSQPSESSSTKDITSPSTETSASASFSGTQTPASSLRSVGSSSTIRSSNVTWTSWSHLKPDLQTYLQYHQENISYFHYFFKLDAADFIHSELIDLAIGYEPLLYAIVGFAAYHHTVRQPGGKLSTFLKYYSHSLSSLRRTLESGRKPTEATILTILTLGTFDEYLGDWVNLVGHHRAAHRLITALYTPENIMETETSRQIFLWCARFDVVAGLMGGNSTSLGREWYIACEDWYIQREEKDSFDINARLGFVTSAIRLIGFDMAGLLSSLQRGTISMQDFLTEYATIGERIDDLRLRIQSLNDGQHAVNDFPYRKSPGPYDIVDPYIPGGLFSGPLFALNFCWIDWLAVKLMYRYQFSTITRETPPLELAQLAYEQCRIFEAIERWPESPPGATLGAHASLGIASVFLQKEHKPIMWCRLKLAALEGQGYVYPKTFRKKMAEMWHLPEVTHWWLPDNEGYHPVLQSIREFSEERSSRPSDDKDEDIRDMKMIFSKLDVEDFSPRDSPRSASGGSTVGANDSTLGQTSSIANALGRSLDSDSEGAGAPERQHGGDRQSSELPRKKRGGVDRMSGIWEGGYTP